METAELRAAALKTTRARLLMLRFLRAREGSHLSAENIHKQLLSKGQKLASATVYRVLADFEKAGMVASSQFETGPAVYEFTGRRQHDPRGCAGTGASHEFADTEAEPRVRGRASAVGHELSNQRQVLFVLPATPPR